MRPGEAAYKTVRKPFGEATTEGEERVEGRRWVEEEEGVRRIAEEREERGRERE